MPRKLAALLNPAWLPDGRLSAGGEVSVDGRPGHLARIRPAHNSGSTHGANSQPAEAVIDAELGILLRLTYCLAGQPELCLELRGVSVRSSREAAVFRIDIAAGARVVPDTGRLLDEANAPVPVKAAADPAGRAANRAVAVANCLRRHPGPQAGLNQGAAGSAAFAWLAGWLTWSGGARRTPHGRCGPRAGKPFQHRSGLTTHAIPDNADVR